MTTSPARPLPVDDHWLAAYRLRARQLGRTAGSGAHITRRLGQSLEFRELAPFSLGDDIRHIDLAASARAAAMPLRNPLGSWMTRRFVAEEQFKLVISVDSRPTMEWPQPQARGQVTVSKLQIARWIASAVALIALDFGDRVAIHGLFGDPYALREIRRANRSELEDAVYSVTTPGTSSGGLNLLPLERALPPSAIWIIITDLYTDVAQLQELAQRMIEARAGRRTVLLFEMDSWPCELALAGRGARRIDGPVSTRMQVNVDDDAISHVESEITARRQVFDQFGGLSRWSWPESFADEAAVHQLFISHFASDPALLSMFMRDI